MDIATQDSRKWWTRWRTRTTTSQPEAFVTMWKSAWLQGAHGVWQHQNRQTNPYRSEMQRAAWYAGAKWAQENPDRRTNQVPRFAHPRRRAGDAKLPATIKRAAAIGATSLTLYAMTRAWRWARRTPDDAG